MELLNTVFGQVVKGKDKDGRIQFKGVYKDKDGNVKAYELNEAQLAVARDVGDSVTGAVVEGTKSGGWDLASTAAWIGDKVDRAVQAAPFLGNDEVKKYKDRMEQIKGTPRPFEEARKYTNERASVARDNTVAHDHEIIGAFSRYIPTLVVAPKLAAGKGLAAMARAGAKLGAFTAGEEAFYNLGIDNMTPTEKLKASAQAGLFGAGFGSLLNAAGQGIRAFRNKRALGKGENASEEAKVKGGEQVNRGNQGRDDLVNNMSDILNGRQPQSRQLALPPAQPRTITPESTAVIPSGELPPARLALPPAPVRYGRPMPTAEGWNRLYDFEQRLNDYENTNSLVRALNEADTTDLQRLTRPEISMREQLALPPAPVRGWGDDTLADTWGRAAQAPSEYDLALAKSLQAERAAQEAAMQAARRANAEDAFGRQLGEMSDRETNALRSAAFDDYDNAWIKERQRAARQAELEEAFVTRPREEQRLVNTLRKVAESKRAARQGELEDAFVNLPNERQKLLNVLYNAYPSLRPTNAVDNVPTTPILPKTETPINPTPSTTTKSLNEAIAEQKAIYDKEFAERLANSKAHSATKKQVASGKPNSAKARELQKQIEQEMTTKPLVEYDGRYYDFDGQPARKIVYSELEKPIKVLEDGTIHSGKGKELSDPIPKKANKTSIADLDEVQRQAIYNSLKDNDLKALGINRKNINALEKILRSPVGLSKGLDKNNIKTFNAINEYLQKANTTAEGNIVKQADKVIDSPANALDEIINDADTILRKEVYDVAKELKIGRETAKDIFVALSTNATHIHPQLQKPYSQIVQRLNEKRAAEARVMEDLTQTEEALKQINPNYLKGLGIGLGTAGLVTGFNTEEAEAVNLGAALTKSAQKLIGKKTPSTAGKTATVNGFSTKLTAKQTWDSKLINMGRQVVEKVKNTDLANWIANTKMNKEHDYLKYRDVLDTQLQRSYSTIDKIFRTLSELPLSDREDLHKIMTGQNVAVTNKQVIQLADTFTKEITKLSQRLVDLGIITQKTHDEWAGVYLHRTYENSIRKNLIRDFRRMKTIHPIFERGKSEIITAADVKVLQNNGMIGKISEGKISVTKNADGTYTGRRDWTPDEREIMGEVTDGAFTVAETFKHLYEMIHVGEFLKNVADNTNVGAFDDIVGNRTLKGRKWGAMNGRSVPTHIYQDLLNQHNTIFGHQSGLQRIWHTYLSAMKKSWTIYNPVSHVNNVMSNVTFMASSGMDTHRAFLDTMKGFAVLKKAEEFKDLEAKTLAGTADSAQTARFNELSNDADIMLFKEAEEVGVFGKTKLQEMLYPANVSKKTDGVNKIGQAFENAYHAEDNAARFAFYKYLKNDMGLDSMAAKKGVQSIMPDYSAPMSRAASLARNSGIIPFISWTYHTLPAIARTLTPIGLVKGDRIRPHLVKSPYGKGINKYQAWNTIKTILLVQALGEVLQGRTGVPDEQPLNWERQRPISWRSGDDVTGVKMDKWFAPNDWLPMNIPTTLLNFATGGIPQKLLYSLKDTDPYRGTKITYRDGLEGAYDRAKYYSSNFLPIPSILKNAYDVAEAAIAEPEARKSNQFYNPLSLPEAALRLGGINIRSYNAPMYEQFQKNQLLKELKKQNKENNREKRKQRKTMQTRPTR